MQVESAERRRESGRRKGAESGRNRVEPRGERTAERESVKEIIPAMQQKEKKAGEREGEEGRRKEVTSRKTASEGGERRRRVHQLEKEKLELSSKHNQEVCGLQAELTRLRCSVERGGGSERRAAVTVAELQKSLDITRRCREEDQHALQQEVEERDKLIHTLSSENQRLHHLLQDQEEAQEEAQREREKEEEERRREHSKLKYLEEKEERSRREKEERARADRHCGGPAAERAAHLGSKFSCEILQLRGRDLEATLSSERIILQESQRERELLKSQMREEERERRVQRESGREREAALHRLQQEYEQCKSDLSVALETERTTTSDLRQTLEEEKRGHTHTHTLLEQAAERQRGAEECVQLVMETLQQHTDPAAKHDGSCSPCAAVLQLLRKTLETKERQIQDLQQLTSDQSRQLQELQQVSIKKISEYYENESKARLSFLYCVYQRLLAGCVLLRQPQSMLGNFTWQELCDVINEQVGQVTSDLREANDTIAHLQSVCEQRSVCVREQQCVLSRLKESVRRGEEERSSRHTHTVTLLQEELQVCRSQLSSLRHHASSLTSDLSLLRGEASCFLWACVLLGGALTHTHLRLQQVCVQKRVVCRRLQEREGLEGEVRRLLGALGKEEEEEEEEGRKRKVAVRRWRKSVCVVMAVRRWRWISKHTAVVFRLQKGGGCSATETQEGQPASDADGGVCARWLRSKRLSSVILSSMADLQGALTHSGSSPPDVTPLARSALSRLLDHLLDQSEAESGLPGSGLDEDWLSGRFRGGLNRVTPPQLDSKALVSTLQQHFLVFSQRLHSAEVERRGLRLEVANLKRGLRQEREESCKTVPEQQFHSVCVELRQALSREQEVQALLKEQTDAQHTLGRTAQSLCDARQEVTRKDRSLRILGTHLSGVQRERKHLEEELSDTHRRRDCLISNMRAAETSYKQVRESLVQSRGCLSAKPRPLPALKEHLSGAECIMGAPEVAACQTLLSSASQLFLACCSRIGWLEQEVSAHISHVTALRGELQDVCLRDNLAFVPVEGFPEAFPLADVETWQAVPLSDWSNELPVSLNPAPFSPLSKEVKKKKRGGTKQI
ncbi:hypothetical protein CesoFtcFv8_026524 [Champsocephalus esox]|uniref:Coiled-coil domain containing 171 n=1 Tax=Champsocephalus esox TaxID=159716 RepID=A0AAN8AZB1_9TELE|nr:hypothetical protein CesoFtcFv8_026524 [Champsocephalus esox]